MFLVGGETDREVLLDGERKKAVFREAHIGHPGLNLTRSNISRAYVWHHVNTEVKQLVRIHTTI